MFARRLVIGSALLFLSACGAAASPPAKVESAATEASASPEKPSRCGGFMGIVCPLGLECKWPNQDGADLMG